MKTKGRIRTAAFMDELSPKLEVSLPFFASLGISLICLRFVQLANHSVPTNAIKLTKDERAEVKGLCKNHGVDFSSLGSPIGKANILGADTDAAFAVHLDQVVKPTAEAAADFGIKKVRIFGGYYAEGTADRSAYLNQGCDRLAETLNVLGDAGLVALIENERGLFMETPAEGAMVCQIMRRRSLGLVYDGANLVNIGLSSSDCEQQIAKGKNLFLELHLKDLDSDDPALVAGRADGRIPLEKELTQFRPVGRGAGGYRHLYEQLAPITDSAFIRLSLLGLPAELNMVLEPHMDKSEQFYGSTSEANFRLALEAHQALAAEYGIELA